MSTNYYFRNKEEYRNHQEVMSVRNEKIKDIMDLLNIWNESGESLYDIQFRIENIAHVGYEEIHIGKRSVGWKPSFERHGGLFETVRELKTFYENNKNKYEIINEYGEVLNWEELKENLFDWDGEREKLHDAYKDCDGFIWHRYEFS